MQTMNRLITLLLTLSVSFCSLASIPCDKPYILQVGPEFSSDFMVGYLGGFTLSVAQSIECGTRIKGTKDYKSFINSALSNESNIYLIPEHFLPSFIKRGYIPVLQRKATSQLLFVTSINDITKSGYGKTLPLIQYTPSVFSIDYMLLSDWLNNTLGKINITHKHNHTYPAVVLKTMETSNTIGSITSEIFTRLPKNIQNKLNTKKSGVLTGGYFVIRQTEQAHLKQAIIDAKEHLHSEHWTDTITIKETQYSDRLEALLQNLEKSTK